ncbi:MAG: tetrahydrofolate dehydrogenase/cyclohydrolase catalytic domain-containing protein [Patescibacteria group bacterium]
MILLDGRRVGQTWRDSLKPRIESLKKRGITPGLGVILVGDDPASHLYVARKEEASRAMSYLFHKLTLPTTTETSEVQAAIVALNQNPKIHGIIIQLPLPAQIDTDAVLETIDPQKDVDGLHPANLGDLLIGHERMIPATPKGIVRLLEAYNIETEGKHVVIVGRSTILGKPLAALFLNRNATVTICHSKTENLGFFTRQADLIVMDTGVPNLLQADMVAAKAVVIDAGITKLASGAVVGDVDFVAVAPNVAAITPVPGGVGPMTIAAILDTTLELAERTR